MAFLQFLHHGSGPNGPNTAMFGKIKTSNFDWARQVWILPFAPQTAARSPTDIRQKLSKTMPTGTMSLTKPEGKLSLLMYHLFVGFGLNAFDTSLSWEILEDLDGT